MMMFHSKTLYKHQMDSILELRNGNILCGGVGSGKSRAALVYYLKVCNGLCFLKDLEVVEKEMSDPLDLYIITTARKRDTKEWDEELKLFNLYLNDSENSLSGVKIIVDSWNNIKKYKEIKDSFFIFDEQRVIGYGSWTKSFLNITLYNKWILLSATPGDTWMDYIPVFIANGFYKNKTDFIRKHVVFNRFCKYPKVDRYLEEGKLNRLKNSILVTMNYNEPSISNFKLVLSDFDKELLNDVVALRWNPYKEQPIQDVGGLCYISRRIVNSDISRLNKLKELLAKKSKIIVFYNFDYELDILRQLKDVAGLDVSEWNGHKHESIPDSDHWVYLVQYLAGAEGWNCTITDTIIFYSLNYSYKIMVQSAGRINRLNTKYKELYYYCFISNSFIDKAILKALKSKKTFNEKDLKNLLD